MSTLEKFGILVILILVVIIGVVAVWGVGGDSKNPFGNGATDSVTKVDPAAGPADPGTSEWPPATGTPVQDNPTAGAPVAPPAIGSPATPAATPPADTAAATTYTVKAGDTPAKIAQATLGDSNKWKALMAANPGKDPRRLKIGDVLNIPGQGGTVAKAPTGTKGTSPKINTFEPNRSDGPSEPNTPEKKVEAPKAPAPAPAAEGATREVEVQSGDTLYRIASRELGDANLYYKIVKVNPGLDPKRLKVGMKIKVPVEK